MRAADPGLKEKPDEEVTLDAVSAKDDYSNSTRILIGDAPRKPRTDENSAEELKAMVEEYKVEMLKVVDQVNEKLGRKPADSERIRNEMDSNLGLVYDGGVEGEVKVPWSVLTFNGTPLAATISHLTKMQSDVLNAESDMIAFLFNQVDAGDFKFDKIEAKVIPQSNYVIQGDTFRADLFVAAYSSTENPEILAGEIDTATGEFVGEHVTVDVEDGVGKFAVPTSGEGVVYWGGVINLKDPSGNIKPYSFSDSYRVAKPSLVVSPTKMNVFYRGVDNPVSVSAPGVPNENLRVSINNGTIRPTGGGNYNVNVRTGTQAVISVQAEMPDGSTQSMGRAEFRCKAIPNPVPKFAGAGPTDASVNRNKMMAAPGVIAEMEDFDFDLNYTVTRFDITAIVGGSPVTQSSRSNRVTADQKALLQRVRSGQQIYIENVRAKGPDGTERKLAPISLKVI